MACHVRVDTDGNDTWWRQQLMEIPSHLSMPAETVAASGHGSFCNSLILDISRPFYPELWVMLCDALSVSGLMFSYLSYPFLQFSIQLCLLSPIFTSISAATQKASASL